MEQAGNPFAESAGMPIDLTVEGLRLSDGRTFVRVTLLLGAAAQISFTIPPPAARAFALNFDAAAASCEKAAASTAPASQVMQ